MAATYRGEIVTVLRPAGPEDEDYKVGGGEQVLIRMSDSTEMIVPESDVEYPYPEPVPGVLTDEDKKEAKEEIVKKDADDPEDTSEEVTVLKPKVEKVKDKTVWNRKGKKK
jgi:hypothetical protein